MQRNCLQLFQFFLKKISQQKGLETSAFIYMVVIVSHEYVNQVPRLEAIPGTWSGYCIGGGEGVISKVLYMEVIPLPFYLPFLTEKIPLLYTVHW